MTKNDNKNIIVLSLLILIAVLSRFIPHLPNFSPIMAIALFGGFYFKNKKMGLLVPIVAMLITDFFLGLHSSMFSVYLSIIIGGVIGSKISQYGNYLKIAGATLLNSIIFYLLTNFSVWLFDGIYTRNIDGLIDCYYMALPFFRNAIIGDIFYVFVLFGSYHLIKKFYLKPIAN